MKNNKITFTNPKGLFDPTNNGFSHIVKIPMGKELYFFSGQWASDDKGQLASRDFEAQVYKTVSNIKTVMEVVGITLNDVVKQTVYIADFTLEKKNILIKVASKEWKTENYPTSTIVPVSLLATAKDCLIEIEFIAAK
tara:strand:- start:13633 stop:14046 length:414 start_codon:yes stop_codon:yes gene_type:complete